MDQEKRCNKLIYRDDPSNPKQCSRKGIIIEDGKCWCKQHAPSTLKRRRDLLDDSYEDRRRENKLRKQFKMWSQVIDTIEDHDRDLAARIRVFAKKHDIPC